MKTLLLSILTLVAATAAFAQDQQLVGEALPPILIEKEFTIKKGDTKIIPLSRFVYVDRISLEVKNSLLCSEDHVRLSFDGFAHQNLKVEGGGSGYRTKIVLANVNARAIEIYNSSSCKIKIKNIEVLPRRIGVRPGHGHNQTPYYAATESAAQVSFLLETFLYLDQLVGDTDRVRYLSPGKKTLGKSLAILQASPETSQASLAAVRDVLNYLNTIEPFLEKLATIETTFDIATEIQSVKANLERSIR